MCHHLELPKRSTPGAVPAPVVTFPTSRRYWPPVGQGAQAWSRRQGSAREGERHPGSRLLLLVSARDAGFLDRNYLPACLPAGHFVSPPEACMVCHMPMASRTLGLDAGHLKRITLFQDPALGFTYLPTCAQLTPFQFKKHMWHFAFRRVRRGSSMEQSSMQTIISAFMIVCTDDCSMDDRLLTFRRYPLL